MEGKPTIALIKSQDLNTGVNAEYWRIVGIVYVENEPTSKVLLAGWLNAPTYKAGKLQLALVTVELSQQLTNVIRQTQQLPTKELLYSLVQATPQFTGAEPSFQEVEVPAAVAEAAAAEESVKAPEPAATGG